MVNNKLKVGLGLLTVLATPIAVDVVAGSEVHAAEQKPAVVEKSATAAKSATENKQNLTEKPAVVEKSDNKAVVADKKATEKLADNKKIEAIGKQEIVEKAVSEEKQTESVKKEEIKKNTLSKEGGKPADGEKEQDKTGYDKGIFYDNGKLANWWYDDGSAWYFFQNGKKHTGEGKDNAGIHYFVNGKYANGYEKGTFYDNGKLANWWYDDGTSWYFFQNGKKHTGEGKDNAGVHYFVEGKYGTGEYNGKIYIDGKETTPIKNGYKNGFFFVDSKLANWWHDDGKDWYFFKNGKKYTGIANDSAGTHRFVNGKYDNNVPAINMPQYYQSDARWGRKVYGIANMTSAGCVPTALAMAFSGLGKPVTPVNVADVIYYNTKEFNVSMIGTSGAGADYAIKYYNFTNTVIKSKSQLVQALQSGNPVFALVGNGDFVKGYAYTHGIMLSGYQNGKTKAMDPASAYNTNKWYNVDRIWDQRSTDSYDTMLGGSFMLIEKK